jgi:Fic family protein
MPDFAFLQGLDKDIQSSLLNQLRYLWTHTSTSLEGNTLSLGETKFVIEEGLTISGKSLKDHQEVVGHARAIDILYDFVNQEITKQSLFNLHKAIQTQDVSDIFKPQGAWKNEPNGTYAVDANGKQVFIDYASPADTPKLMKEWLTKLNFFSKQSLTIEQAISGYSELHLGFVHIHPFWDGNGRLARLLSNIPLLKSGFPPLMISQENGKEYIQLLAIYQLNSEIVTTQSGVWTESSSRSEFEKFCTESYKTTIDLIDNAKEQQVKRLG